MYETCKDFRYKNQAVVKLYIEKYVYWKMGFKQTNWLYLSGQNSDSHKFVFLATLPTGWKKKSLKLRSNIYYLGVLQLKKII